MEIEVALGLVGLFCPQSFQLVCRGLLASLLLLF